MATNNLLRRYVYGMRRISQTAGNDTSFARRSLFARSPKVGWDRNADKPRDDEKLAARRQHGLSGRTEGDAVAS